MVKIFKSRQGGQKLLDSYDRLLGLWGVPVEESDVETRYGATHVVAAGDSNLPPLVLFHGVGDNSAIMWVYNAAALAAHFRLYAIDTMGGPGKSRPNGQYGKGFRQELWLDDVLDGLSLKQAYLAGVSNGAYLAQLYAARRPERVARCACLAGSLALGSGSPLPRMLRLFLPEALFPTERNVRKLLRKLCGENHAAFTDSAELMLHWGLLLRVFNNMAMGYHRIEPLSQQEVDALRNRALFLLGDRDPLAYSQESVALLERQGMQYRVYPRTGHGINHEQAEQINRELIAFFAS